MEQEIWQCTGCPGELCFVGGNREENTLSFHPGCIKNKPNALYCWKTYANHKITEIPEPVWVLDIPFEMVATIDIAIYKENGTAVEVKKEIKPGLIEIKLSNNEFWIVCKSWLKQKPAEPTVEELQLRLDKIINYVSNENGVAYFNKKNITALANGEK